MNILDGPRFPPRAGGAPERLVVLLHGYGANGNDLIQLAPILSQALPDAQFVAPDAPEPVPGYPAGRQWFALSQLDPQVMEAGCRAAAPVLDRFLDLEMTRYRLTPDRVALVGFSQGTMMALHVAPRRAEPFAAVVGFSGALCGAESLKKEVKSTPPVFLAHGDADELVHPAQMFEAARGLADAGLWVLWHVSAGTPHGIAPDEIDLARAFLADAFAGRFAPAGLASEPQMS